MKLVLETERLILREHTVDDAQHAYTLNLDPEVLRYTGDDSFKSIEEAGLFLNNYDHYKKYGFGRWAVIEKASGNYLGWCGLKFTPELNEFDIGYRFMKKHWNKGFASEAAKACIELGFNQFNMRTIVGRAMRENGASIKILTKIGLTFFEERNCSSKKEVVYKIDSDRILP